MEYYVLPGLLKNKYLWKNGEK